MRFLEQKPQQQKKHFNTTTLPTGNTSANVLHLIHLWLHIRTSFLVPQNRKKSIYENSTQLQFNDFLLEGKKENWNKQANDLFLFFLKQNKVISRVELTAIPNMSPSVLGEGVTGDVVMFDI